MIKTIGFNNKTIKYRVENENSKKTFFLFHGLGDTMECFKNVAAILKIRKIKTVMLDWPGHGENKGVVMPFEDTKHLIKHIYHTEKTNKNYFIGHSLGGLAVLTAIRTYRLQYEHFISIESTLTEGDKAFFRSLQEPTNGAGIEAFMRNDAILKKPYFHNWQEKLRKTDLDTLKQYVSHVYLNFDTYQQMTRNSGFSFDYVYGSLSSNQDERYALSENPNIIVVCFQNAFHWTHLDAEEEFLNYLETIIYSVVKRAV